MLFENVFWAFPITLWLSIVWGGDINYGVEGVYILGCWLYFDNNLSIEAMCCEIWPVCLILIFYQ